MKIIDKPNWPMIILLLLCAYLWVNVYFFGFFQTIIWTLVVSAIIGIILNIKGII